MIYYTRTSPIPPLRADISGHELMPGVVVLYDEQQYSDKMARLPSEIIEFLLLLDGQRTAEVLAAHAQRVGRPFSVEEFLEVANVLEDEYFLDSERFRAMRDARDREFSDLPIRPAAHAGVAYPDDPQELRAMLDSFLETDSPLRNGHGEPAAIVAPHIDFRVGGSSYGPAYNALRESTADTYVIFGVSHQLSYDHFMVTSKDFETPLGTVEADREVIEQFRAALPFAIATNDIAHRQEHSIEFQAVFLKHLFPDRPFRIVPILTGSLHEYVESGTGDAASDERLGILYRTLASTIEKLGRRVCYIAGADLCHIGMKFGDDEPAQPRLPELREHDARVLDRVAAADAEGFLHEVAANRNANRICGVAPIYALLRTAQPRHGVVLAYDQWDEVERESAVTYGSVALYR